jgi:hypothetical protein
MYQVTPQDEAKASGKLAQRTAQMERVEADHAAGVSFRKRQTTYGLKKRDTARLLLTGDIDYYEGRGQGMIDQMMGLEYTEERRSKAYNMGYHDGFHFSESEMRDYIARNPNFAGLHRSNKMEVEL